jgi:adenylosuccinate lyase
MPHKRNPIISERLCGQARVIRANMLAAFENIALWHERDISHSSVERIILPDSTILLHYMLKKACWLIDKLNVYPEAMAANMDKSFGLLYSQRVLLALVQAGMLRDDAYAIVQRSAMKAWEDRTSFQELLKEDTKVIGRLSPSDIEACFDPGYQLRNMGVIFDRVAALEW